jgi:hypothetical protein
MPLVPVPRRRTWCALLLAYGFCASVSHPSPARAAEKPVLKPGSAIAPSVRIAGTTFELKDEKQAAGTYVAEYLPAGENFERFTRMFAVWGQQDGSTALAQVKAKIQFVEARKGTDPVANYKVFKAEDENAYGLDFLISEGAVLEHNVWYFKSFKGGVVAYQYARRHYRGADGQATRDFFGQIGPAGSEVLAFFKANPLPVPPN